MIIGIPKEIKDHEYRVALTPEAVSKLTHSGHRVLVEKTAGEGSGYTDQAFQSAGAKVISDCTRLFGESELILKVKEPLPQEYNYFRKGQILFSFLHLASDLELTKALLEHGVTAIAFETIQLSNEVLPVLRPMSEIAGRMASMVGAHYLQKVHGGSGILLPGVPGISPARVVILGGGTVGTNAARMAVGLGGQVTLFHRETERLRHLDDLFRGRIVTRISQPDLVHQALLSADLLIGAVLIPGARAPKLVSRKQVAAMRKGSVIVDVSIDQGGCVETSRPTTHSDPVFIEQSLVHYCVSNMPGAYPRTATAALANEIMPYLIMIAGNGVESSCDRNPALSKGLNIHHGKVMHQAVAQAHGMPFG
jgi:alanine dehydrogenase